MGRWVDLSAMNFIFYLLLLGFAYLLVTKGSAPAKLLGESEYKYFYLFLLILPLIDCYFHGTPEGESEFALLFINIAYIMLFYVRIGYIIFAKAGYNGWLILIPIYSLIILFKIVNRPLWWLVFLILPIANFVIHIIVSLDIAKSFKKDVGYGIGLAFLAPVFYPILALGDAEYSFLDRESGKNSKTYEKEG